MLSRPSNCIEDQGLDLVKSNVDYAAEDPAPKDDASLKMIKSDHEDDDTQPIMISGYEGAIVGYGNRYTGIHHSSQLVQY